MIYAPLAIAEGVFCFLLLRGIKITRYKLLEDNCWVVGRIL